MRPVSKARELCSACEAKEVKKQPTKDLMADVDEDDRAMKRRLNVGAESELQMHQGSLVELTELINETYCITLQCVSLLISTLIGDAVSLF